MARARSMVRTSRREVPCIPYAAQPSCAFGGACDTARGQRCVSRYWRTLVAPSGLCPGFKASQAPLGGGADSTCENALRPLDRGLGKCRRRDLAQAVVCAFKQRERRALAEAF